MYRHCVLLLLMFLDSGGALDAGSCLPWTYRPNATSPCKCGSTVSGAIECNITARVLRLEMCFCVTNDHFSNDSVAGYCPYSCITNFKEPRHQVQLTYENFTDRTCGVWKRHGPLCSKCIQNHGLPLFSYDLKCVECTRNFRIKAMFRFLAVSLIPPTVLCIVITVFHLSVLRPPWSVFVLVAQQLSSPIVMQLLFNNMDLKDFEKIIIKIIATIYGPWNLDFFKALYPPTCISPHTTALQVFVIEGLIGLYPLVLLAVMYSFITLRDRGCRFVLYIWKPFHFLLSRFWSKLNLKASLIDAFATFLLLSYMKMGYSAFYILAPSRVYSPDGTYVWAVYVDPSVKYFGPSHIGYALPALLFSFILLIFPILLLFLYPCQWFQRCLNHFHLRLLVLHAFVDAFQGCYKDGTNGTRDCRYFTALLLLIRLHYPFLFFVSKEIVLPNLATFVVLSLFITLFFISQPYKHSLYNKSDSLLLMVALTSCFLSPVYILLSMYNYYSFEWPFQIVNAVCYLAPLLYFTIWSIKLWNRHCTQETMRLLPHME